MHLILKKNWNTFFFKSNVDFQRGGGGGWRYLAYEAFFFLAALWKQTVTVGDETADWLDMETVWYVNKPCFSGYECAYPSLVPQYFVSLSSAQLLAAVCWEIQPVALVQHPHQFPQLLAKRSVKKYQSRRDHRLNYSLQHRHLKLFQLRIQTRSLVSPQDLNLQNTSQPWQLKLQAGDGGKKESSSFTQRSKDQRASKQCIRIRKVNLIITINLLRAWALHKYPAILTGPG